MKFNIFTKPWMDLSLSELASLVKELGFNGVELPIRQGYQVIPNNISSNLKIAKNILLDNGALLFPYIDGASGSTTQQTRIKQFSSTNLSAGNFIGFSKEAYTNGQTATVKVVGNVSTQSGLTPGQQYYVQNDGTLGLTAVENNSIEAGKALTATSLLIKG